MIKGSTYILNKDQVKLAGSTNFGWETITLVERRVSSTETFDKMKWPKTQAGRNGEKSGEHKVTRHNYEWVVFTHSDQGYVTVDQDLFEDETGMGIYQLSNWRELRDNPAIYNLVEV
jgi:hypothetical protein